MPSANPEHGTAEAVVFDMDGVIVESEHLWEELWTEFAAARGVRWGADQTKAVQGMSAPEWARYLAEFVGKGETAEATEQAVVDGMIRALDEGRIDPLDGAPEMIIAVSAQAPIAMASSAPRRVIDAVLAHHGLLERFTATVSSAEVARGKPNPDVYLAAAEKLGVAAEGCLAVEDSSNGLRAAAAAGMSVVAMPNPTYPPAEDAIAKAVFTATDLHQVCDFLLRGLSTKEPSR